MRSHARELCEQHGYPSELAEVLDELVGIALAHLGDVHSLVLSPSISTGDFLWKTDDAEIRLLSDIDGFIYLNGSAKDAPGFDAAVKRLSAGRPKVRIDLSVNPVRELDRLPHSYQFVETGLAGFVLYGAPVLDRFPTKFDPRVSRQAFLLNLFKPLDHSFLHPDADRAAQAAARLLLDIPLLAASERGECIVGHRARARWFLAERPPPLGLDAGIRAAVSAAIAAREDPPGDAGVLAPLLHAAIPKLVSLLDPQPTASANLYVGLANRLAAWLPPRPARRILGECAQVLGRLGNPVADLRWLLRRKEASMGAALLGLLDYVACGAVGEPPERIRNHLRDFARRECSGREGLDFVRSACEVYREGLLELYPAKGESD